MTLEAINPSRLGTKARLAALEARVNEMARQRYGNRIENLEQWRQGETTKRYAAAVHDAAANARETPWNVPPAADSPSEAIPEPETAPAASDGPIVWGAPIEVNGVRPSWVRDNDAMKIAATLDRGEVQFPSANTIASTAEWNWHQITHIRLPASHPAYTALDAGFVPWPGGDEAPGDYAGGGYILRDGLTSEGPVSPVVGDWSHPCKYGADFDIIGYHRASPADTLTAATDGMNAQTADIRSDVAERVEYIPDPDRPNDPPTRVAAEPKHVGITSHDLASETAEYFRLRLAEVEAEKDELRAAIPEWLCDKCQTIHPKPANPITLGCPRCAGLMRPTSGNERRREAEIAQLTEAADRAATLIRHQREEIGKLHGRVPRYTEAQRDAAELVLSRMSRDGRSPLKMIVHGVATELGLRKAEG